ncbi:hypothetical protein SKTS_15010 [Sulfurimicrobium lacus]|uniref:Chorismatase FkbO/Hyg5-like N-terminal domain-containing protein n=1 Tax=Sulfurimicrobium lacus TaxID=2715678 RepID=A0A6F8VCX8_9PROT|nr:hypothetical protein [Sulfurimicrobium lacus]BCB26615.1 hypothetical protein SKTS_15010 [Sulfurimicrobium lacus]
MITVAHRQPANMPKNEARDEALGSPAVSARYLPLPAARDFLTRHAGQVLGVVCHGLNAPFVAPDIPLAEVAMPQLGEQPLLEIWTAGELVTTGRSGNISWARTADCLFGSYRQLAHESGLEAETSIAYQEVFALLEAQGIPKLLRIWNYFAAINADEDDGLERYKHFCIGRHDAFAQYGRLNVQDIPAASAVGSRGGEFVLYFLAATRGGRAVENERQVSAYDYPPQYSPRSPLFARATEVDWLREPQLFISGTASIVGHASICLDDAAQQTAETLKNIGLLLGRAFPHGEDFSLLRALKVYIRHEKDFPVIRSVMENAVGREVPCLYLLADICRSELLLEIEAIAGEA